jgi:hypothetical protein
MYYGEMRALECSLSWKLGLHPLTLALSSNITSYWPKNTPIPTMTRQEDSVLQITIMICYLYVIWTDVKAGVEPFIETRLASINFCPFVYYF